MPEARVIDTPDGPMTRDQAAAYYGIKRNTLIRRIWQGRPKEDWFKKSLKPSPKRTPPRRRKTRYPGYYVTPYGRKSGWQMAAIVGVSEAAMASRLYNSGWTIMQAFNTPPYGKPGVHFIMPEQEYRRRRLEQLEIEADKLDEELRSKKRRRRKRRS